MNAHKDHGHSPRLRRNLWKRTATAARAPKTLKLVCPEWRILVQINQESLPTGGLPCSAWERGVNPQGLLPSPRPQEAGGGRITARARQGGVAMKHLTWAVVVVGLLVAGSTLPAEAAGSRGGGGRGGGTQWHTGSPRGGRGWHTGSPRWHGGVHSGGGGWHGGPRVFIGGGPRMVGGSRGTGPRPTPTMPRRPWWSRRRPRGTSSRHPRLRRRPPGTTARTRGRTTRTSRNAPAGGCRWCRSQAHRAPKRRPPVAAIAGAVPLARGPPRRVQASRWVVSELVLQ